MHKLNDQYVARQATPEDVDRIIAIWLEGVGTAFGGKTMDTPLDEVRAHMLKLIAQQDEDYKFWLAVDKDGRAAGWTTIQPLHSTPWEEMRRAFGFMSTFIATEARGKKLATLLTQFALDYCREHTRLYFVVGMVGEYNAPSAAMTRNAGLTDMGAMPKANGFPILHVVAAATK